MSVRDVSKPEPKFTRSAFLDGLKLCSRGKCKTYTIPNFLFSKLYFGPFLALLQEIANFITPTENAYRMT